MFSIRDCLSKEYYSGFQIDKLHHHNQNLVGTLHATSILWSTDMKTVVRLIIGEVYYIT